MSPPAPRFTSALAKVELDAFVARVLFLVSVACAAVGVLLVLLQYESLSRAAIAGILSVPVAIGLSVAAGAWLARRGRMLAGIACWIGGTYVGSTAFAVVSGVGVHSIVLGFYGVLVIIAGAAIGARAALVAGLLCAVSVLALYGAEVGGQLPGQQAADSMPLATRVTAQLLIVLAATAFGAMLARALAGSLASAREQEQRFARLLAIAADWYWEQDAELRYTHLSDGVQRVLGAPPERFVGRRCEELIDWAAHGEAWTRYKETLAARRPFRDFVVQRPAADGRSVYVSLSGEPVFDAAGRFTGYWGTGRDVSDEMRARREIEASERRFRDLFELLPSAVVVHRDGVVLRVNQAAATLFGYGTPAAMAGIPVFDLNHPSSVELSRQRIAAIKRLAVGEMLSSPAELHLRQRDGNDLFAQAVGARIELPDGDAVLSIYFDVTERRQIERRLAEAKEQAEAASRAKSEFLANTSHEIRTPLNGLLGLARLALDPATPPERSRECLRLILDSSQTLAAIITDILDLSKIEAGKLDLESVPFDLHELLGGLRDSYRELAAGRPLAVELRVAPAVPRWVRGDPMRVRQVAANFLSNALKFTASGRIVLYAEDAGSDRVRLGVGDTGIGIDEATQRRLFAPFMQADASTTRRFGGTGLGLSICRQLAQLMGGRVGVHSGIGRGSDFWAELPLPAAPAGAADALDADDDGQPLAGMHLLVVEDNAVNLMIVEAMVSGWGARATSAADGRAALDAVGAAAARGEQFDAVLMDMHMPVMSGYDATAALRRDYTANQLPVIALTAAALTEEKERCLALGVNEFLTKPVEARKLLDSLRRWRRPLAVSG